jgi:hypothetical protein
MRMNQPRRPEDAPGHYGAGYGEQVPEGAPPRPAPATDADEPLVLDVEVPESPLEADAVTVTDTVVVVETPADTATTGAGSEGERVDFTPDDVTARPPDRPPTETAPESEKAGLIFERS